VYVPLAANLRAWIEAWKSAGISLQPDAAGAENSQERRGASSRAKPELIFSYSDDLLQIADLRRAEHTASTFEGPLARIYRAAVDRPVSAKAVADETKLKISVASIERALKEFCERGLMMSDEGKFLSLALPATRGR
jgi:hypothetical protein